MPEMQSVISSLILNIVNIIILFVILRALVYNPVKKFMAARQERVDADIKGAREKLKEAQAAKAQRDAELAEAVDAADKERRRILDAAESHAAEITAAAEEQADEIRNTAQVQAQHTAEKMREEAREEIADLAVEIASRVLEREVKKGDNQEIIDKYFDRVV